MLLPLLWACAAPPATTATTTPALPTDPVNTEVEDVLLAGGGAPLDAVVTVVEVRFTVDADASDAVSRVVWSFEDGAEQATAPVQGPGEHRVLLVGAPALAEVRWRIEVDTAGERRVSDEVVTVTGQLLPSVPAFTLELDDPARYAPGYVVGVVISESEGYDNLVLAWDRQGRVVWYHGVDPSLVNPDLRLPLDGSPGVLFNTFAEDFSAGLKADVGAIQHVTLDGVRSPERRTVLGHHVFAALPDGTLAFAQLDLRETTWTDPEGNTFTEPICGEAITELAPDGTERVVWSSWDHLPVEWNRGFGHRFYGDACIDWLHANQLAWDPTLDSYLFSLSNIDTMVEVDRTTGATLRWYGLQGDTPPYAFAPGTTPFVFQHGAHYTEAGTLLLSSRHDTGDGPETVILEYAVDHGAGTLTEVWSHGKGLQRHAFALGEAWRQPNGNTLLNTGTQGVLEEVTADGDTAWRITAPLGIFFGRTLFVDDLSSLL